MVKHWLIDRLACRQMSRREFATAVGALGLGLVTITRVPRRAAAAPQDLLYFTWAGYDTTDIHPGYAKTYGVGPQYALFGGTEEAYQKLTAGFAADVAHPCVEDVTRWRETGLIRKLDPSRIAPWKDLWPELFTLTGALQSGEPWFLPFDWGNGSILYRTDMVQLDGADSWMVAFDQRYAGKIAMYNATPTVTVAALALGINPFDFSDADGARIKELLMKQRKLVRFYWDSPAEIQQALAAGEIAMAYAWNDSLQALTKQGVPVKYMVPKEGILSWTCGVVHLRDAKASDDEVYAFLNAMAAPEAGKYIIENFGYGHVNRKSFDLVPPEVVQNLGFGSPTELFKSSVFERETSKEMQAKRNQIFEDVKAGA